MKTKNLILGTFILAVLLGCGVRGFFRSMNHSVQEEINETGEVTPEVDDTTVHVAPDKEVWDEEMAAMDKRRLKGMPKRDEIDWEAEGAEYLPERPNQPVEVEAEDVELDSVGARYIVRNRINVMLEDDSLRLTDFANEFKRLYPSGEYEIIYADPLFRRLQIRVPDEDREEVKRALKERMPERFRGGKMLVWDESVMTGEMTVNDTYIDSCWHHGMVNTFKAWDISRGSENVVVAVLDDGFALNHEDLRGKSVKPFNVYTKDGNVSETGSQHGTHVAGLIVAEADNDKGIAGVAPGCRLMPIKVYDGHGYCTFTAMLDAIMYAIYHRADVVNISLETMWGSGMSERAQNELIKKCYKEEERIWRSVFATASRNRTTVVVAAGNENILAGVEPMQRSENVIVVAAVDRGTASVRKTDFSNWGRYTDVSAPGRDMYSTVGNNHYASRTGTSMASPIVAGAVALMKSVDSELTTKQIVSILQRTGLKTMSRVGRLVQIDKALACARDKIVPPIPSTGELQILLTWNDINDLDLYCIDPSGECIYYQHRKAKSGGVLEIDMNVRKPYSTIPIENIYWPVGGHPKGKYVVAVSLFGCNCEKKKSEFEVIVRHGDKEQRYYGEASTKKPVTVCEFEVE